MSAFLVSDVHISAMLWFWTTIKPPNIYGYIPTYYWNGTRYKVRGHDHGEVQATGQVLVEENYKSFNARYNYVRVSHEFVYTVTLNGYTPVEILKACDCYDYQSCETGEDYYKSRAYAIVKAIREHAIRLLPGYEEADWEITSKVIGVAE